MNKNILCILKYVKPQLTKWKHILILFSNLKNVIFKGIKKLKHSIFGKFFCIKIRKISVTKIQILIQPLKKLGDMFSLKMRNQTQKIFLRTHRQLGHICHLQSNLFSTLILFPFNYKNKNISLQEISFYLNIWYSFQVLFMYAEWDFKSFICSNRSLD